MRTKVAGPNILTAINIIDELQGFPVTAKQLSQRTGLHIKTVYVWLDILKKRRKIYVDRWVIIGSSIVAKWSWGDKDDAPKPVRKKTISDRKEYYRLWRLKRKIANEQSCRYLSR